MIRDPLLPVRLVDGVRTTEGAVEIGGQILHAKVTYTPPPTPEIPSVPPTSREVTIPITVNADDWRKLTAPRVAPSFGYNPATGETVVSFDAEAACPGEAPIPVRAVVTWPTPAPKVTGSVDCSPTLSSGEPRFWADGEVVK